MAGNAAVTLFGFRKDHTSSHLDWLPGWRLNEAESESDQSASDLRRIYFETTDLNAAISC